MGEPWWRALWLSASTLLLVAALAVLWWALGWREDVVERSEPLAWLAPADPEGPVAASPFVVSAATEGRWNLRAYVCFPRGGARPEVTLRWDDGRSELLGQGWTTMGEARCAEAPLRRWDEGWPATLWVERAATAGELALPVVVVVVSRPVGMLELGAVFALLLAMLLRLLAWTLGPGGTAAEGRWRAYDPLVVLLLLLVLPALIFGLWSSGGPSLSEVMNSVTPGVVRLPAWGQRALSGMVVHLAFYLALTFAIVWWRFGAFRQALALVAPQVAAGECPWKVLARAFGMGVLLALAATALLIFVAPEESSPMIHITRVPGMMLASAAMACVAPWFEEVFFRGFLYGSIAACAGRLAAAVASVVLFTAAHIPQHLGYGWPLLPILGVAIGTTWWRQRTASTTAAFSLHLGYNAALVLPALLSL